MSEMPQGLDPTAEAEVSAEDVATPEPDFDTVRRALRELEAAKARVERDAQRAADEMREKLVIELLPLLDNLDRTIYSAEVAGESQALLQGVRQVRSQFASVLGKYGIERIEAKHQRFDPRIHDAISLVPVSHPAGHDVVVDQIEAGYRFGDKLLRPAKVVVGRHAPRWH